MLAGNMLVCKFEYQYSSHKVYPFSLPATEAYRSMVSGSVKQQPQMMADDDDDTDEDVEKQFASTLSPRETSR